MIDSSFAYELFLLKRFSVLFHAEITQFSLLKTLFFCFIAVLFQLCGQWAVFNACLNKNVLWADLKRLKFCRNRCADEIDSRRQDRHREETFSIVCSNPLNIEHGNLLFAMEIIIRFQLICR